MNNTKHTPGPWVVRNMSDAMAEKFTVERLSDNGLRSVICRINDMEVCPEHGGTGSDANAALIAAAPAMYEALRAMLEHEGERVYSGIGTEHDSEVLEAAKQAARAALAQADGKHV